MMFPIPHIVSMAMACVLVASCSTNRYGSVSEQTVQEALAAPKLALTPHQPGWLLQETQVYPLSAEQMARVRAILQVDKVRRVDERYYREEEKGNRHDSSPLMFYLYASNAQCLGGRVVDRKVLMDDFELSEQESEQLYTLLSPILAKIFPGAL